MADGIFELSYTNLLYHLVVGTKDRLPLIYIRNQEAHHARISFEEEFKALLRSNGIEFEELYL